LALYVDSVYGNLSGASGLAILLASLLFAYEIFADFSGYSDIAKGSAALFGINVVENFDQPYRASSSKDFLAALAHQFIDLLPRLRLYPHGRQPRERFSLGL
jgi:D-alanyl-lipoteichoic acid acyltransferase DltB (MBOAT superfamily)